MLKNYLLISIRNLLKHKGFSFLNIAGLAIGMTVFILITVYVNFERSFENFIPNADNIYRVQLERYQNGELIIATAENVPGAGPAMKNELPEVENYTRLYNMGYKNNLIITNEAATPTPIAFKHRYFLYADSSFLPMMGYEMIHGDPTTALAEPLQAVISEKYAKLYFGNENPIGKELRLQDDDYNDEKAQVTGVFKDLPANTHLKFDVLYSYKTILSRGDWAPRRYDTGWGRNDMYTFVQLKPGTDHKQVDKKLAGIVKKYSPDLEENNQNDVLSLQPLTSIHLHSDLAEEPEPNGDESIVFFMSIIGILVLIIAWINYINLSTARAMERAKEVGIRKVSGALKSQLVAQFLIESAMVNGLSIIFAMAIAMQALPFFNHLTGLTFRSTDLLQPWLLGLMGIIFLVGTFLSGLYPAIVLSSFRPVTVLKGQFKNTGRGLFLRKALVVLQFTGSVALIASTLIIFNQMQFMLNQNIGMDIEQVLVVERPGITPSDREAHQSAIRVFRSELEKNNNVQGVSTSLTIPGKQREFKLTAHKMGETEKESKTLRFNTMDHHFLDIFKMKLLAGRAFSEEFSNDPDTSCIITESAVQLLGFKNPEEAIGQVISLPRFRWNPIIVGVINDYHQVSLKKAVDPTIFSCQPSFGEFYSMRVNKKDLPKTIEHVRQSWETAFAGNPFDFFFLDEYFAAQYENEQRFSKLAWLFACLAILVGCLGLFGLSGYTVAQRTKEIGIRRVLGASPIGLVGLLSKDTLKLIFISILLAAPLSWWAMEQWLENFAYRINIEWWFFALAGGIAILVAFFTISFQSVKAAWANPVESLKTE